MDTVNICSHHCLCFISSPFSPFKANPAYKGKWYAPLVDNPEYKGEWAPRKIANPGFFEDLTPAKSLGKIVSFSFTNNTYSLLNYQRLGRCWH